MPVTTCAATRVGLCIGELTFKDDKNRGAKRNQRIGPQSRQTLPPLAFEADDATQQEGHQQIDRVFLKCGIEHRHSETFCGLGTIGVAVTPGNDAPAEKKRSGNLRSQASFR